MKHTTKPSNFTIASPLRNRRSSPRVLIFCAILLAGIVVSSCASPQSNIAANEKLFPATADLKSLVLKPADVSDIFPKAGYSISRGLDQGEVKGYMETFPTASIQYTIAFAEGFETQVRLFPDLKSAQDAFNVSSEQVKGDQIKIKPVGDQVAGYLSKVKSPDGLEIDKNQYALLIRDKNILIQVLIRVDPKKQIAADRLDQITSILNKRLSSY